MTLPFEWHDPNNWTPWHLFDETNYKTAISRFEAALLELTQSHTSKPIRFYCEFNNRR